MAAETTSNAREGTRPDAGGARPLRMAAYFVLVQGVMLGSTGQWRDLLAGLSRTCDQLRKRVGAGLAAASSTGPAELAAQALGDLPSVSELHDFLFPRLVLLTCCGILAFAVRLAYSFARQKLPAEARAFAKAQPPPARGAGSASRAQRPGGTAGGK